MSAPIGNQFAKGHGMGRPSLYDDEYVEIVEQYISECGNKEEYELPTIEGLARYIGVTKQTMLNWGKEHKDFLDALAKLKDQQAVELINKGLNNKVNPTIAKLVLSANHGMREGTDVTTDGKEITFTLHKDVADKYATNSRTDGDSKEQ
jgi:DNA-binding XRE family transcriptional regulator